MYKIVKARNVNRTVLVGIGVTMALVVAGAGATGINPPSQKSASTYANATADKPVTREYIVKEVLDGDTFVGDNLQRFRLENVYAADETHCGYQEAKDILDKLITGKKVTTTGSYVDDFGRLLAKVEMDGKSVSKMMIDSSWAVYDSQGEEKWLMLWSYLNKLRRMGIFGKCVEKTNTKNPKCLIKGNNRESTDDHIYIKPGCKGYTSTIVQTFRGDQWFCSEEEAVAAKYRKAENCK